MLKKSWEKVGVVLRIYLTNNVTIEHEGEFLSDWRSVGRQGRLVLTMLLAESPRAVSREELADELWPVDSPPSRERALTAIISKIRTTLDSRGLGSLEIASAFGSYQVRLPSDSWVDIHAAAESIDKAEGALRNGHPRAAWPLAQATCHIARRPFLVGDDGIWVQRTRRNLRTALVRSHECLAAIYVQTHEFPTAIVHAGLAGDLEPFRETAHLLLMQAHAGAGNRAEALRAYERCRVLLAEELGVSPSDAVESAYLEILRNAE